jgi:hypothetical protein
LAEQQIEQSKGHAPIIAAYGFLNEPAAQHPRPTFWHPQVELPTISAVLSASLRCVALMEVTIVHPAGRPQPADARPGMVRTARDRVYRGAICIQPGPG